MASGKRYRAKGHISPGLIAYPDQPAVGTLYVPQEAIANMRESFIGKPVVNEEHSHLSAEELLDFSKEELDEIAAGIVSAVGVDEDGSEYVDFVVWDDETQKNLDSGYSVSNSYDPLDIDGEGGDLNGVPFDTKLLQGRYRHLAIVPNPRYDNIDVFENSKPKEGIMKLFKLKTKAPVQNAEPEVEEVEMSKGYVQVGEEKVPVEELMNMYREKKNAEPEEDEGVMMNMEDEIEIDGEKIKVADLVNMCQGDGVDNAEIPINDPAEEVVDEEKQEPYENSKGRKPVNQKLKTTIQNGLTLTGPAVQTRSDRFAAGKAAYSKEAK